MVWILLWTYNGYAFIRYFELRVKIRRLLIVQLATPIPKVFFQYLSILASTPEGFWVSHIRWALFVETLSVIDAVIVGRISARVVRVNTRACEFLASSCCPSHLWRARWLLRLLFIVVIRTREFIKTVLAIISSAGKLTWSSISEGRRTTQVIGNVRHSRRWSCQSTRSPSPNSIESHTGSARRRPHAFSDIIVNRIFSSPRIPLTSRCPWKRLPDCLPTLHSKWSWSHFLSILL